MDLIDLATIFAFCVGIELLLITHFENGVVLFQLGLFVSLDCCAIMPVFSTLTFLFSHLSFCLVASCSSRCLVKRLCG